MTLRVLLDIHLKMDILPFELQSLICCFSAPEDLVVVFNALGYLQPVILDLWPSFGHSGLLVATKFDNVALAGASQPSYSLKALEIACMNASREVLDSLYFQWCK